MADQNVKLPPNSSQEIGRSGTYFFKGYVTAEEYSIDLQGKYALQVYDVMRRSDATVHAALNLCKQPILAAEWKIEPASNEPADQEIADRANFEFFNRNLIFSEVMREGLTYLDFGFYVAEQVYETADWQGKPYIGLAKIASRKQRSILKWEMDDGNPGVTQILPSAYGRDFTGGASVNIPRNKLLVCTNDQEGENYYGISLLRYAYKPWKIKDGLEIMNAVALENMALGVPQIIKEVENANVDARELEALRTRLRQQRVNEESFLEVPYGITVQWTDLKGQTTKDVLPTIHYQDQQILLSVLGQFLLLGQQDTAGSRAVSQDHSRLFVKALIAVARQWQQAFQRDVLNKWVDLNYSNLPNGYPKLVYSTISDEDVAETATAVNSLMTVGALTPDKNIENRLRSLLNLPPLSDDDFDNYTPDEKLAPEPTPEEKAQKMKDQQDAMKKIGFMPPASPPISPQSSGGSPDDPSKQDQDLPEDDKNEPAEAIRQARRAKERLIQDILTRA